MWIVDFSLICRYCVSFSFRLMRIVCFIVSNQKKMTIIRIKNGKNVKKEKEKKSNKINMHRFCIWNCFLLFCIFFPLFSCYDSLIDLLLHNSTFDSIAFERKKKHFFVVFRCRVLHLKWWNAADVHGMFIRINALSLSMNRWLRT